MAHYAKVENALVTQVIVAEPEFFDTFVDSSPGEWIQTSYNTKRGVHLNGGTPLRKNYAGVGYTYDGSNWVAPEQSWLDNIASEEARLLRNRKLKKQVDPIVSNTLRWAEFSSEKQQEWVNYRRLLLDITETEGFPNNIAWPEPPQ